MEEPGREEASARRDDGVRAALALVVVVPLAGLLGRSPAAAQQAVSRTDSLLLVVARDLLRGAPETGQAWPAEWFTGEFMLLRPEGGALAVFDRSLPASLGVPLSTHPVTDSRFAHFLAAGTPGVPTRFDMPFIDGRQLVAFPFLDSVYSVSDPVLSTVSAVYHEAFHLYQLRSGWFARTEPGRLDDLPRELITGREFQDLAARERDLLGRALYQANTDSAKALLRTYLATRSARTALLPAEHQLAEARDERMEASAQLVGYRAALLAVEGSADDLMPLIAADLRNTPAFDDPSRTTSPLRHWQIYATGSAIGILLDRFGVSWRRELEQGATFVELLARAVAR